MIPGLKAIPAFNGSGSSGSGGGASGLTMAFLASATSTSGSITIPGSAIAGDWAILLMASYARAGGTVSAVTPSGWTTLANSASGSLRSMVVCRILPSGGAGGTAVSGMNDDRNAKVLLVFRPSTSIVSVTPSTWNAEATSSDPSSQSVNASGQNAPLIVAAIAAANGSAAPAFSTETPSMTNITKVYKEVGIRVGYTVYNSSPSSHSIDMGDNGTNVLQSGYVRFT